MFSYSYLITDMLFLPHRYLSYLLCRTVFLLLLSPFSAFGLRSLQEGASLCPLSLSPSVSSSSLLFYFTSVQAAHLFWLAWVRFWVGRCGRKESLKKYRVVVKMMVVGVLRKLSVVKAQTKYIDVEQAL